MEKIRVNVTQRDIDEGEAKDCQQCPIARALWRVAKRRGAQKVQIGRGTWDVEFTDYTKDVWGYLPDAAKAFVNAFDLGKTVQPRSFTLTSVDTDEEPVVF